MAYASIVSGNNGARTAGQPATAASARRPAKLDTAADVPDTAIPRLTHQSRTRGIGSLIAHGPILIRTLPRSLVTFGYPACAPLAPQLPFQLAQFVGPRFNLPRVEFPNDANTAFSGHDISR